MFGLIDTSEDVRTAEREESDQRMRRLADKDQVIAMVVEAARDAAEIMALVEEPDERTAWLSTFALAVVNLLEDCGFVEVLS
jgi:hypothetical protein